MILQVHSCASRMNCNRVGQVAGAKRNLPPWQGRFLLVSGPSLEPRPKTFAWSRPRVRRLARSHGAGGGRRLTSSWSWTSSSTSCRSTSSPLTSWPWRVPPFWNTNVRGSKFAVNGFFQLLLQFSRKSVGRPGGGSRTAKSPRRQGKKKTFTTEGTASTQNTETFGA